MHMHLVSAYAASILAMRYMTISQERCQQRLEQNDA